MARFEWLSFDIHLTILNFLEPLDILRLRRTCKILQRTTSERIVWINALLRVCVRNTIFLPTFPIHDMSQSALEYAVTGPERFLRTAAKSDLLEPRSHYIIQHEQHDEIRELFLVPGGRYLVTKSWTRLAVWDLGIPGSSSTQSMKQVSTLPTHPEFFLLVHPTEDGRGLTILIDYVLEGVARIAILRIYPSDTLPSLLKDAELDVPSAGICSLSKNKVIYLVGSTLNLWDYVEDAWACIQVPSGYQQIMVSESAIVLPYRDLVLVWKMPPLSKSKPLFSGSSLSNIPPAFHLKIPNSQAVQDCRGPCDWYSGSSQPLLFDFTIGNELQRFEVVHRNENFNEPVVATLGKYPDTAYRAFSSCRFCNDNLVSWCAPNGRVEAHIANIPSVSHTSNPIDSTITILPESSDESESGLYFPKSLCPFSGRFAYTDGLDVTIVDYFSESLPMVGPPKPLTWA